MSLEKQLENLDLNELLSIIYVLETTVLEIHMLEEIVKHFLLRHRV